MKRTLGKTARKGERTGVIELDEMKVGQLADKIIDRWTDCRDPFETRLGERWVKPKTVHLKTEVDDIATGEPIRVDVLVDPDPEAQGIWGYLRMGRDAPRITSRRQATHTLVLRPPRRACMPVHDWKPAVRGVLTHELAHAADRGLLLRHGEKFIDPKKDRCGYFRSPHEIAAYLAETRDEILSHRFRQKIDTMRLSERPKKPEDLLRLTSRWRTFEECFGKKEKRRFLRMIAGLWTRFEK